jgi:30S ribosomal protein S31
MGKGDIRSKRGKIFRGTYGNTRLRKKNRAKHATRKQDEGTPPPRPASAS